eukprot:5547236-Pyramimonas_sp.AAC.1
MNLSLDEFLEPRRRATGQDAVVMRTAVRNTRTKLPNGRASMLVDLGSRINLVGDRTLEEDFKDVATEYGLEVTAQRRPNRLHVIWVGSGIVPCDEMATILIVV